MELYPTGTMPVIRNPFIRLSRALAGKCPWLLQCSHFLPECCSVEFSGFHISKHSVRETEMEFLILDQILYALKEKLFFNSVTAYAQNKLEEEMLELGGYSVPM